MRTDAVGAQLPIGCSSLVVIGPLLSDDESQFVDLGPDHHAARNNPSGRSASTQALGYPVTLGSAA